MIKEILDWIKEFVGIEKPCDFHEWKLVSATSRKCCLCGREQRLRYFAYGRVKYEWLDEE